MRSELVTRRRSWMVRRALGSPARWCPGAEDGLMVPTRYLILLLVNIEPRSIVSVSENNAQL